MTLPVTIDWPRPVATDANGLTLMAIAYEEPPVKEGKIRRQPPPAPRGTFWSACVEMGNGGPGAFRATDADSIGAVPLFPAEATTNL